MSRAIFVKIIASTVTAAIGLLLLGATAALSFPGMTWVAGGFIVVEFVMIAVAVITGEGAARRWMDAEIDDAWIEADKAIATAARKQPSPVMPEDLATSHASLMTVLQSAGHAISDALRMSSQLNTDMGALGVHLAESEDERAFLRKRVAHLDMFVETARQGAQRQAPVRQSGNGATAEPVNIAPASGAAEPFSEGPLPSYLTRPVDLDDHRGPEAFAPPSVRSRGLEALKAELLGGAAKPEGMPS